MEDAGYPNNATYSSYMHFNAMPPKVSHKVQEHQATKRYEAAENDAVPPLLRANLSNQAVDTRNLTGGPHYPAINIRYCLSLHPELFIDSISLTQYPIYHIM